MLLVLQLPHSLGANGTQAIIDCSAPRARRVLGLGPFVVPRIAAGYGRPAYGGVAWRPWEQRSGEDVAVERIGLEQRQIGAPSLSRLAWGTVLLKPHLGKWRQAVSTHVGAHTLTF